MNLVPLGMIIFFDGVCVLCNSAVDFLLRADKKQKLKFAPLQGKTYSELLLSHPELPHDVDTIVVWFDGKAYFKSQGVLRALEYVEGPWSALAKLLKFIPSFISDFFYDVIAKTRHHIFGKREACRLPGSSEKARFLD